MKKIMIVILVVLLAAMTFAVPVLADSGENLCAGLARGYFAASAHGSTQGAAQLLSQWFEHGCGLCGPPGYACVQANEP